MAQAYTVLRRLRQEGHKVWDRYGGLKQTKSFLTFKNWG